MKEPQLNPQVLISRLPSNAHRNDEDHAITVPSPWWDLPAYIECNDHRDQFDGRRRVRRATTAGVLASFPVGTILAIFAHRINGPRWERRFCAAWC
ncbi:hypothetical protein IVB14_01715 [Bradyrhizobium sp. 180]|uniref:hypothetical protein n=1 Tax=Bradyrhizobium sp. 180 TaxID=2782650 RepID=UPI001FF95CA6|nr:hypothetical protein [Bradyrhizobium sp. 180]MCK1489179.1 hypothetical protein [Bradyrhizobium sp. 180]